MADFRQLKRGISCRVPLTILKLQIELISSLSILIHLDLLQASGVSPHVWLGGTDVDVEGTWVWTDESPGIIFL